VHCPSDLVNACYVWLPITLHEEGGGNTTGLPMEIEWRWKWDLEQPFAFAPVPPGPPAPIGPG
jgi:hypothetical protein